MSKSNTDRGYRMSTYPLSGQSDEIAAAILRAKAPIFAIPKELLEILKLQFGAKLAAEACRFENQLHVHCSNAHCIGFYLGRPISSESLDPASAEVPPPSRTVARGQAPRIMTIVEGFTGWLLTNPEYRAEQSQLFSCWAAEIAEVGLSGVGQTASLAECPNMNVLFGHVSDAFQAAVASFLCRWRLLRLVAPDVPVPMRPVVRGVFPVAIVAQILNSGRVCHIPDTFPIPSRDELRHLLAEGLQQSREPHLAEWHRMVRARDHSKMKIGSFARLRFLFHYWRVFQSRHRSLLRGGKAKLQAGFAAYFRVDEATIKRDLRVIQERLGRDWAEA